LISVEHLDVIAGFRKSLSDAVHPAVWEEAEAALMELSKVVDPAGVKRFASSEVRLRIDPDGVRPDEKDLAEPGNSLSLRTRANGWVEFHGLLEPCSGGLFGSQISAMSAPTSPPEGGPDPRTLDERQGDAMAQWVDLGRDGVPTEGGERPQLVVTIGLDQLISGLGYGAMGPDQLPFSVSEARRLACDIGVTARSCPLFSVLTPSRSTSGGHPAPFRSTSVARWSTGTKAARFRDATNPDRGVRCTILSNGSTAVPQDPKTSRSCAVSITGLCTIPSGKSAWHTAIRNSSHRRGWTAHEHHEQTRSTALYAVRFAGVTAWVDA
jgi:hypothetical protein